MKKIFIVLLAIALIGIFILNGCAEPAPATTPSPTPTPTPSPPAKEPIVLKLVAYIPDFYPGNLWTNMFIDKVNEKAKGELTIEWAGGPEAVPVTDAPASVQMGTIDMANGVYSFVPAPATAVECVCWSEISYSDFRKNGAYDLTQQLFNQVNIFYLGHSYPTGANRASAFFSNVKIEKPEDFAGLRVALMGPEMLSTCEALNAIPQVMPFTDYYTAMERGTVDTLWLGVPGLLDFNIQEVAQYMIDERVGTGSGCFIINLDKWNELSKNLQDIMIEAAVEVEEEGIDVFNQVDAEVLQTAKDAGMEIIKFSPADSERMHNIHKDAVWEWIIDKYPEYGPKFEDLIAP